MAKDTYAPAIIALLAILTGLVAGLLSVAIEIKGNNLKLVDYLRKECECDAAGTACVSLRMGACNCETKHQSCPDIGFAVCIASVLIAVFWSSR